jgi:outer membrane cobalamin receptor
VLMEGGIPEDLTPDRIDRVEVLKGEAAERMHGADAAVGVVQIFTKPGSGSR